MPAEVLTNLESIGDMIGALTGISEGMNEEIYVEGLIRQAHSKAASVFNVDAAATAKAGKFPHVFEFGTAGITRGQPLHADPMSPDARLWVHELVGHGGNQDIVYRFRPATTPNPRPTTGSTGVPSKTLAKLSRRKYIFWNKAYVMETGQTVSIKSDRGDNGFLFVPFNNEPPRNPNNNRGFVMWNSKVRGPLMNRPGKSTKGEFEAFWLSWWAEAGQKIMYSEMERYVTIDIDKAMAEATKRAQTESMKPVQETNIVGTVSATKAFFKKLFGGNTIKRLDTITK